MILHIRTKIFLEEFEELLLVKEGQKNPEDVERKRGIMEGSKTNKIIFQNSLNNNDLEEK